MKYMHTLTRQLLVVFALALPLPVLNAGVASGAANGADRPFSASGSAAVTVDLTQGLEVSIAGTLNATHMGRSTWQAVVTSIDLAEVITVTYVNTITAANGDALTTEAVGVIDGTAFTFTAVETITGGTGRFAGASGSFTLSGAITEINDPGTGIITIPLTVSSNGTISY